MQVYNGNNRPFVQTCLEKNSSRESVIDDQINCDLAKDFERVSIGVHDEGSIDLTVPPIHDFQPLKLCDLPESLLGTIIRMVEKSDFFHLQLSNQEFKKLSTKYMSEKMAVEAVLADWAIYEQLSPDVQHYPKVILSALSSNPLLIHHPAIVHVLSTSDDQEFKLNILGTVWSSVIFALMFIKTDLYNTFLSIHHRYALSWDPTSQSVLVHDEHDYVTTCESYKEEYSSALDKIDVTHVIRSIVSENKGGIIGIIRERLEKDRENSLVDLFLKYISYITWDLMKNRSLLLSHQRGPISEILHKCIAQFLNGMWNRFNCLPITIAPTLFCAEGITPLSFIPAESTGIETGRCELPSPSTDSFMLDNRFMLACSLYDAHISKASIKEKIISYDELIKTYIEQCYRNDKPGLIMSLYSLLPEIKKKDWEITLLAIEKICKKKRKELLRSCPIELLRDKRFMMKAVDLDIDLLDMFRNQLTEEEITSIQRRRRHKDRICLLQ